MTANIRKATEAHTALCLFEAVVRILESGDIKAVRQETAQKIITLCKVEQSRCLFFGFLFGAMVGDTR